MGQAIVIYDKDDLLITVDSDELELMSTDEVNEIIREAIHTHKTGESDFFTEIEEGPNPPPVYPI